MTDFDAIDALLAAAKKEAPLPPAEERRTLREELSLSRAQLAQALQVSPSTVAGWEAGRDPSGDVREKYAYFLDGHGPSRRPRPGRLPRRRRTCGTPPRRRRRTRGGPPRPGGAGAPGWRSTR